MGGTSKPKNAGSALGEIESRLMLQQVVPGPEDGDGQVVSRFIVENVAIKGLAYGPM